VIVYLDASALVKRYVAEVGSAEVEALIGEVQATGTAVLSRAEVAAALAKAARVGLVAREAAQKALESFNADWEHLIRLQFGEPLAARAASLVEARAARLRRRASRYGSGVARELGRVGHSGNLRSGTVARRPGKRALALAGRDSMNIFGIRSGAPRCSACRELKGMEISQYRLAKGIGVPPRRINEIVHGKRAITADTALRLGKFFGMEAQFWMNLQSHYDLEIAKDAIAGKLDREVEVLKAA